MRQLTDQTDWAFRQMTLEDLAVVVALEKRAFAYPWSAELLRQELDHTWSTVLLAEDRSGPVPVVMGLVIFWLVHDELHILNVASDPAYQRRGVARFLIGEAIARARGNGCVLGTLEVRRSNQPAIALYEGFGFRTVGVRARYYREENEDALVMLLDL